MTGGGLRDGAEFRRGRPRFLPLHRKIAMPWASTLEPTIASRRDAEQR